MKRKSSMLALAGVTLAALACGPLAGLTGDAGVTVDSLWADVPAYPGATRVDLEMPLPLRLVLETARQAAQGRLPGDSGTLEDLEFIAYSTPDSTDQIFAFYSHERMADEGWNVTDGPGCEAADAGGQSLGTVCVFARKTPTENSALFVLAGGDEAGGSLIFYARADGAP